MSCLEELGAEVRRRVLQEVGYSEASLLQDLETLKRWANSRRDLPSSVGAEPDCFFESFLVGCKGNTDLARKKLLGYFAARSSLSWLLKDWDPTDLLNSREYLLMCTMARASPAGCRLSFAGLRDPAAFDIVELARRCVAIVELRARAEGAYGGEWAVLDFRHFSPAHILAAGTRRLRDFVHLTQKVYPSRFKGVIIINAPSFTEKLLNILVKPFLSKKLAKRIFIYSKGGGKPLLKHFPKEMIPKDFGGDGEEFQKMSDMWLEEAVSKRNWFKETVMGEIAKANADVAD